jgi:hypothetical protein
MRQKLALVLKLSLSVSLKRMNGFSPVTTTRLGSTEFMDCFLAFNDRMWVSRTWLH